PHQQNLRLAKGRKPKILRPLPFQGRGLLRMMVPMTNENSQHAIGFRTSALIDSFLDMLLAERNAATNTRMAYRRDLTDAAQWLAKKKGDLAGASEDEVRAYLQTLGKAAARTQARRLSVLRQFYRFLCSEHHRQDDPSRAIDAPKLGRSLPKYLSEEEVK